eukprot:TRINITY_DN12826_c0_g1_i2.p1 TRINITY_DN12826_c0_g1~~TRINITY_DN12826_c0_g1_i2.p1  ORF type:complete len:460 (-),score=94.04 TRINITY_DN12826_c0_g1_i2:32-1411(-)
MYIQRLPGRPPSPEKGESNIVREAHREYNILSNNYWTGHDERIAKEREAERKTLKERYWKTHDLDVLTQVYHDPKKEAAIKAEEDVRHELNAIRQASGFPPAVALSEGQCFDITSGVVLDPDKHAYREGKANAAARRKAVGPKFEEMNRKRNEEEDDKKLARLIQRNSYARFAETEKRGYDVLTNVAYKGLGGKPPVKPRMAEPKTLKDFVADPHNLGTPAIQKKLDVPEPTYEDYYEGEGQGSDHDSAGYVDGEPIAADDIPGPEGSIPPSSRASNSSLPTLSRASSSDGSTPPSTAGSGRSKSSRASTAQSQRAQTARSSASSHASSRSSRQAPKTASSRGSSRAQTAASVASARVSLATPTSADLQRASSKQASQPATAPSTRASTAAAKSRPVSTASGVSQAGSAKSSAASAASALLKSRASSRSSIAASQRSQTALSARIASSRASSRARSVKA